MDQNLTRQKTYEAGSVENAPDRTSLISDPDSDGDDDDLSIPRLSADKINRWFKRGASLLESETNVENILNRIHTIEVYIKRWMRVDLQRLASIELQPERVISLDSDDDEWEEAAPDGYPSMCDHHKCHVVNCKQI